MFLGIMVGGLIVTVSFIISSYFLYKKVMKFNSRGHKNNQNKGIEE